MLKLSSDRKVTTLATSGGNVAIANTFGLPAGVSCPGMTDACKSCYASAIETRYSAVNRMMQHNLDELLNAGSVDAMTDLLSEMIATFVKQSNRRNVPARFRIHWDGDFFSVDYASAWRRVILANPMVDFWAYTRSFRAPVNVVPVLAGIPNLALYLSVDEHNNTDAASVIASHPTVRIASLTKTMGEGLPIMRDLTSTPGAMCPEITGQVPLIAADGTGACIACNICPSGSTNVRFATTKGRS